LNQQASADLKAVFKINNTFFEYFSSLVQWLLLSNLKFPNKIVLDIRNGLLQQTLQPTAKISSTVYFTSGHNYMQFRILPL